MPSASVTVPVVLMAPSPSQSFWTVNPVPVCAAIAVNGGVAVHVGQYPALRTSLTICAIAMRAVCCASTWFEPTR